MRSANTQKRSVFWLACSSHQESKSMTRIIRFTGIKTLVIAIAFAVLSVVANAQTAVKGHVNNEVGQGVPGVNVQFSQDGGKTFKYTTETDANGDSTVSVAPGDD